LCWRDNHAFFLTSTMTCSSSPTLSLQRFYSSEQCELTPINYASGTRYACGEAEQVSCVQGDDEVLVEVRSGLHDSFGRGQKRKMPVHQFVESLQSSEALVYLSTQPASRDSDGHPNLMSPLLACLPEVPKKPCIAGALIPQSINVWMGRSEKGTSSGLHHDFHDNLYILLAGTKRFRLFPPSEAKRMYLNGTIQHVHPNGRCVCPDR
jgi:hypothetical protein